MPLRLRQFADRFRRASTPVQAACSHLAAANARTLSWQRDVTRIGAPTGLERARAEWMAAQFATIGWDRVHRDAAGNVIARRSVRTNDGAPAVWCCAHLDTVFDDPHPVVTQDGPRLTGPGIGDNGRGLAALLALAHALSEASVETPHELVMACTVGEEGLGDLRGMRALMADVRPAPLAVIAIDGAGEDRIVHAALGSIRWRITFHGPGGHSWADFGAPNPVHASGALVAALQAIVLPREPRTTLTVARIGGGESINSIPRDGWIEVDLRSTSGTVLADLSRTVQQAVTRVERAENGRRALHTDALTAAIVQLGSRPCGALDADAPLVRLAMQATRTIGVAPVLSIGSTDASIPISLGIPAIAIGAGGRGGGTHTPGEWYDDTRGIEGLQRAMLIITGAAGVTSA